MPYRFITTPVVEMFIAALAAMLAAASSVLGGFDGSQTIWDQSQFRMFCLVGAIGGAFLSVALFPPQERPGRAAVSRLAAKFVSSGICGLLFTPVVIRWRGWPVDVDVVLAVSGAVALVAVTVIHGVMPLITRKIIARLLGSDDPKP